MNHRKKKAPQSIYSPQFQYLNSSAPFFLAFFTVNGGSNIFYGLVVQNTLWKKKKTTYMLGYDWEILSTKVLFGVSSVWAHCVLG